MPSIILLTPVPGRVLSTASHLTESPLGNNSSGDAQEPELHSGMAREQFQADGTEWVTGKANRLFTRLKTSGCPQPALGGGF